MREKRTRSAVDRNGVCNTPRLFHPTRIVLKHSQETVLMTCKTCRSGYSFVFTLKVIIPIPNKLFFTFHLPMGGGGSSPVPKVNGRCCKT